MTTPTSPDSAHTADSSLTARAVSLSSDAANAFLAVKPKLRGWIHAVTAPLALAACIVLVVLAPGIPLKIASLIYLFCSLALFANSGVYHIGNGHWPAKVAATLRSIDHANIFLLIAGTYTPLSVGLLDAGTARLVLTIVWVGALVGTLARVLWMNAPRWLYTPLYVILGWVAVWFLPEFWHNGGPAVVWLIISGGIIYTLGALVYAAKRPDPSPKFFGFHEIFHTCTVAAWICHCVACYLAVLG